MIKYLFLLLPFTIKGQDTAKFEPYTYVVNNKDTAKYCFTAKQMDYWIGCSLDAKTYKNATDSLFIVIDSMEQDKSDLKDLNKSANSLIDSQAKVIRKRTYGQYLWQGISGLIGSAFVIRELRRLYQ